jgi:hypothetical protein
MRILVLAMLALTACDKPGTPIPAYDLARPYRTYDFSFPAGTVICTPPGDVSCHPTNYMFYASTTESGCYPANDPPANAVMNPIYSGQGTCPASYNVVGCTSSPNCSFCLLGGLAIPPGCKVM